MDKGFEKEPNVEVLQRLFVESGATGLSKDQGTAAESRETTKDGKQTK